MLVSNCCEAQDRFYNARALSDDNKYSDYEICPECKEHCEFVNNEEEE